MPSPDHLCHQGQGTAALQAPAAQPATPQTLWAHASTSQLGFHLPSQIGWCKTSSQSLRESPACKAQENSDAMAPVRGEGWEGRAGSHLSCELCGDGGV